MRVRLSCHVGNKGRDSSLSGGACVRRRNQIILFRLQNSDHKFFPLPLRFFTVKPEIYLIAPKAKGKKSPPFKFAGREKLKFICVPGVRNKSAKTNETPAAEKLTEKWTHFGIVKREAMKKRCAHPIRLKWISREFLSSSSTKKLSVGVLHGIVLRHHSGARSFSLNGEKGDQNTIYEWLEARYGWAFRERKKVTWRCSQRVEQSRALWKLTSSFSPLP